MFPGVVESTAVNEKIKSEGVILSLFITLAIGIFAQRKFDCNLVDR